MSEVTASRLAMRLPGSATDEYIWRLVDDAGVTEMVLENSAGTELLRINATGIDIDLNVDSVEVDDGAAATPSISFKDHADTGLYLIASSGEIGISKDSVTGLSVGQHVALRSTARLGWDSTGDPTDSGVDVVLTRLAANKIGLGGSTGGNAVGGTLNFATAVDTATAMSGATVTLSNLIPAGCFLIGVSVYVDTAITGATSFDVGDGTDADRWGDNIAVAADTTTSLADLVGTGPAVFTAANDVVLTAVGSNFTAGAVTVTVHYLDITAGT